MKGGNVITSIDTAKAFDKVQHPFMTQCLRKLGVQRKFLNTKGIY